MPFTRACAATDVTEGFGKKVEVSGKAIALFRVDGKVLAIDDLCTHDEASLSEGVVMKDATGKCVVECPWHGAHFDLCTGTAVTLPAVTPVKPYAVREENGAIEIDV